MGRRGRVLAVIVRPVVFLNALATLIVGPRPIFVYLNNGFVVVSLIVTAIVILRYGAGSRDVSIVRRGRFVFITGALFDNIGGSLGRDYNIEPFSFVVLLGSLGMVAGRRNLAQEKELTIIQKELEIAQQI